MPGGTLQAGKWTKVISGWGWYSVRYAIQVNVSGGQYRTYPVYSSGVLPAWVTHNVRPYGDIWLYAPTAAMWTANPIS
jgi:hypothetical protein